MKKKIAALVASIAMLGGGLFLAAPASAHITLYDYVNYRGPSYDAGEGRHSSLGSFNARASSLRVDGVGHDRLRATLYSGISYTGARSTTFWIGSPDLGTYAFPGGGHVEQQSEKRRLNA